MQAGFNAATSNGGTDFRPKPVGRVDTVYMDAPEAPDEMPQGQTDRYDGHLRRDSRTGAKPSSEETVGLQVPELKRSETQSTLPPEGSILTGKQEHYLKRELISRQVKGEIQELNTPTALQRFGAPFRSDKGEVKPEDSELPILRYIFVHHVRNFPFLDRAREKEFWQDKLQIFLESFAQKQISSSEDRLEDTKRKKLSIKAQKVVELMMVSGLPTASGYEERIRFSEMEVVDRGAQDQGLIANKPEGAEINGWDVNVAGVRAIGERRRLRWHQHAEFILRVKRKSQPEFFVGRRYGDFVRMHKKIRLEIPGKVLAHPPRKNKSDHTTSLGDDEDDDVSTSSGSIPDLPAPDDETSSSITGLSVRSYLGFGHNRRSSKQSVSTPASGKASPQASIDGSVTPKSPHVTLYREEQRVSLRAFLRTLIQHHDVADSIALAEFLTGNPITLNEEDILDIERRKHMDEKRLEEQRRFYEIARQRAAELDVHMEKFRRDIVESNGLTKLFAEIREKDRIADLRPEYKKFAEWLRIEVAATIYHIFLAEDNSPDMFALAKRIHNLMPYTALKNVIRVANPAAVMKGVLDLFLAQPFGARSLLQRIFSMSLGDSIRGIQKSIDALLKDIDDVTFCDKIQAFVEADIDLKNRLRRQAEEEGTDLVIVLLRTEDFPPELRPKQIERVFNAYVAWNNAVENVDAEMQEAASLFGHLKQLLKLYTRLRDKHMMLYTIEEPVTLQLFRDLFTIFYEPLVRVYKSANVYNSITDFANFATDAISVIDRAQRMDLGSDPNKTVQAFIDLCERHEDSFYRFVHEVHIHDNGLFDQLMGWFEGILQFLRHGPPSRRKLDMNTLFRDAVDTGLMDGKTARREIQSLIRWQQARKKWHNDKTRQKMAADHGNASGAAAAGATTTTTTIPGQSAFKSSDFGLDPLDLQDLELDDQGEADSSEDEERRLEEAEGPAGDGIEAERKRRRRIAERLRRSAGEPVKPDVLELAKLQGGFVSMLRAVLAE